ncbi:hypothetical protein EJB05_40751, partial [Eragrostis curvula]
MCHSAVEAAERVHVRSWWLRRWLWRLRDAASDADEVLRSFRQRRRAAEEAGPAGRQGRVSTLWNAARSFVVSAKSMLFAGGEDVHELSSAEARLEKVATGIGDFLKLIELEIRVSLPEPAPSSSPINTPQPARPPPKILIAQPPRRMSPPIYCLAQVVSSRPAQASPSLRRSHRESLRSAWDVHNYDLLHISHEEYNARRRRIVLLTAKRNIRRAMDKLRPKARLAASCFQRQDAGRRLHALASDIREALGATDSLKVRGRSWLEEWRRELQAVADRADPVLLQQLAAPAAVTTARGRGDDDVRRAVESVETAAAHLGGFMTLLRIYGMTVEGVMLPLSLLYYESSFSVSSEN